MIYLTQFLFRFLDWIGHPKVRRPNMIQNEQGSQRWKGLNSQIVYWAVAGAVWAVWPQAWLIWRWVLQNFGVLTARQAKKVVIRGYDFNLGARKLDIFQIPICNAWQSHDFFFILSFFSFFLPRHATIAVHRIHIDLFFVFQFPIQKLSL